MMASANTEAAYKSAWGEFTRFCESLGRSALPAEPSTVKLYIRYALDARTKLIDGQPVAAPLPVSTVRLHLSAIARYHEDAELDSPTHSREVRKAWRELWSAPGRGADTQERARLPEDLIADLITGLGGDIEAARDKALIAIALTAQLPATQLCGMTVENVKIESKALRYAVSTFRRSGAAGADSSLVDRTRLHGRPRTVTIAKRENLTIDPVALLEQHLVASKIDRSFIWRSTSNRSKGQALAPRAVREILRRRLLQLLVSMAAEIDRPFLEHARDRRGGLRIAELSHTDVASLLVRLGLPKTYDPFQYGTTSLRIRSQPTA